MKGERDEETGKKTEEETKEKTEEETKEKTEEETKEKTEKGTKKETKKQKREQRREVVMMKTKTGVCCFDCGIIRALDKEMMDGGMAKE